MPTARPPSRSEVNRVSSERRGGGGGLVCTPLGPSGCCSPYVAHVYLSLTEVIHAHTVAQERAPSRSHVLCLWPRQRVNVPARDPRITETHFSHTPEGSLGQDREWGGGRVWSITGHQHRRPRPRTGCAVPREAQIGLTQVVHLHPRRRLGGYHRPQQQRRCHWDP